MGYGEYIRNSTHSDASSLIFSQEASHGCKSGFPIFFVHMERNYGIQETPHLESENFFYEYDMDSPLGYFLIDNEDFIHSTSCSIRLYC